MKQGDLVLLKSGGPVMTVDNIWTDNTIQTVWFVNGELRRDGFLEIELILIKAI